MEILDLGVGIVKTMFALSILGQAVLTAMLVITTKKKKND